MRNAIKSINYYIQFISGFMTVTLMLLTVADVTLRYFFNRPIAGTYELTYLVLTFIVFFAVGYAQDHKEHVSIDILYDNLPPKAQKFLSFVSSTVYLVIVAIMCWTVFSYGKTLIATNANTAILKIPLWPVVIISGVGLICYVLSIVRDFLFLKEGGALNNDTD